MRLALYVTRASHRTAPNKAICSNRISTPTAANSCSKPRLDRVVWATCLPSPLFLIRTCLHASRSNIGALRLSSRVARLTRSQNFFNANFRGVLNVYFLSHLSVYSFVFFPARQFFPCSCLFSNSLPGTFKACSTQ